MSLITEYRNWINEDMLRDAWGGTVCRAQWQFGQKSNLDTLYPMWFQNFYVTPEKRWKSEEEISSINFIKELGNRFMELVGDEYTLQRSMLSGNTFGQDGDIHDDWLVPGESLTGVLYLNRIWEDNWGGETIVYDKNDPTRVEVSKLEAGKLIIFDGSNPHIGKGPQRACGHLRCIIAMQAVTKVGWDKHQASLKKQ